MSKYNSTKTTIYGITFDSKQEAMRYCYLRQRQERGEISDLECQVKYLIIDKQKTPEGEKDFQQSVYIADFTYYEGNNLVVEDVKGMKSGEAFNLFQLKRKLMLERHGIYVIVI